LNKSELIGLQSFDSNRTSEIKSMLKKLYTVLRYRIYYAAIKEFALKENFDAYLFCKSKKVPDKNLVIA